MTRSLCNQFVHTHNVTALFPFVKPRSRDFCGFPAPEEAAGGIRGHVPRRARWRDEPVTDHSRRCRICRSIRAKKAYLRAFQRVRKSLPSFLQESVDQAAPTRAARHSEADARLTFFSREKNVRRYFRRDAPGRSRPRRRRRCRWRRCWWPSTSRSRRGPFRRGRTRASARPERRGGPSGGRR